MRDGLITLADAAARLGCHVETLRAFVRKGQLPALRGPHGAYHVDPKDLPRLAQPRRGRPAGNRSASDEAEDRSRSMLRTKLVARLYRHDVRLAEQMLEDATLYPPAHRLLSVHRLRLAGLGMPEIARRVVISERHARRLAGRDPVAYFEILVRRYRASQTHRNVVADRALVARLRRRLEAEGVRSHIAQRHQQTGRKAEHPFRVRPDDTPHTRAWLASAGLSRREVQAVIQAGISAEELNALLLRGVRGLPQPGGA